MEYTLTRFEIGLKAAKYYYEIRDSNGAVIFVRKSNRDYVACTSDGRFFFGRIDLIGKGDHGRAVKNGYNTSIAYLTPQR